MGRHRVPDNEKQLFQRVGLRYETYKRLKEISDSQTEESGEKVTMSDVVDLALDTLLDKI